MKLLAMLLFVPMLFANVARAPENVLVIGDSQAGSIFFTVNAEKKKTESMGETIARLAEKPFSGEKVDFEYKGGTPIDYWSKQGHGKEAIARHPEAGTVIIFLGTNDYYKPTAPDVEPLLREVRDNKMKCVWAGNTAVNGRKWPINAKLKAAIEKDCTYIDSESIQLGDKVHPTHAGVIQWLKLVWSARY